MISEDVSREKTQQTCSEEELLKEGIEPVPQELGGAEEE